MNQKQNSTLQMLSILTMATFLAGIHTFIRPQSIKLYTLDIAYKSISQATIFSLIIINVTLFINIQKQLKINQFSDKFKKLLKRFYIFSLVMLGILLVLIFALQSKATKLSLPEYMLVVIPAWTSFKIYKILKEENRA